MKIIEKPIKLTDLQKIVKAEFGNLIKAVVDIEKEIMVIDAEMHADQEQLLLSKGSKQKHLWGINIYPQFFGKEEFIEFDSMINIRPSQNNRSRGVEDKNIQNKIIEIVNKLVEK